MKKFAKRPTPWLKEVPAGSYTLKELEKLTGKHYCTIKQRLRVLELPKSYANYEGYPVAVYYWPGTEAYEQQENKAH